MSSNILDFLTETDAFPPARVKRQKTSSVFHRFSQDEITDLRTFWFANLVRLVGIINKQKPYKYQPIYDCPYCAANADFSVENGKGWRCFRCGRGKGEGDPIKLVQEVLHKTFPEAMQYLLKEANGSHAVSTARPAGAPRSDRPEKTANSIPDPLWRDYMGKIVAVWSCFLASSPKAKDKRDYLFGRGLTLDVLQEHSIGYNPKTIYVPAERLGMTGKDTGIPAGIVIPGYEGGVLMYVKVRLDEPEKRSIFFPDDRKFPKYRNVFGSKSSALYFPEKIAGAKIVLLTEGELDALLAKVLCGDLCGVSSCGSSSNRPSKEALEKYTGAARFVVVLLDDDTAGEAGSAWITSLDGKFTKPKIALPAHDLTDFWRSGGDCRAWLLENLAALGGG